MSTFYKLFELIGMMISFSCCVIVLQGKSSKNQQNLLMTCLCGLIATVGNVLEVFSNSPEEAMVAIKVAYIGKCYIMTFGLLFVSGYSSVKVSKKLIHFLAITNTLVLISVMCCERHRLYYSSFDYEIRPDGRAAMILGKGPLYFVWIGLLFLAAIIYVIIAAKERKRGSRIAKMRMNLIFLAVAMPMLAAEVFLIFQPVYFDPATLAITMSEVCFLLAVEKYGLLDTIELAQERIIEDTKDGLVVVDNTGSTVLYANPVADALFKRIVQTSGDINLEELINEKETIYELDGKHYEIRISEIKRDVRSEDVQGYIAWIFDMSFIDKYTNEMIKLKESSEKANQAKTDF
ncbi:MAG: hypothetical protein II247_04620 [Lachnospiraceae bacterium]|nr:hypothetical protein [Lachnospiraceae bacterium]